MCSTIEVKVNWKHDQYSVNEGEEISVCAELAGNLGRPVLIMVDIINDASATGEHYSSSCLRMSMSS